MTIFKQAEQLFEGFANFSNANGLRFDILVKVKPNKKKEKIFFDSLNNFFICEINAPPIENKANERLVEFLADSLGLTKKTIRLIRGQKSKTKAFQINLESVNEKRLKEIVDCWKEIINEK